jgi:hypothetical protein
MKFFAPRQPLEPEEVEASDLSFSSWVSQKDAPARSSSSDGSITSEHGDEASSLLVGGLSHRGHGHVGLLLCQSA